MYQHYVQARDLVLGIIYLRRYQQGSCLHKPLWGGIERQESVVQFEGLSKGKLLSPLA